MKKFKFSLKAVLEYKEMVLEEKKKELAAAMQAVIEKEREIKLLESDRAAEVLNFNLKKGEGMTVIDAQSYEIHIRVLQKNIDNQHENLRKLREEEAKKQAEVVTAKQEVLAMEKLQERQLQEYSKAALKAEELAVEELVFNRMVGAVSE